VESVQLLDRLSARAQEASDRTKMEPVSSIAYPRNVSPDAGEIAAAPVRSAMKSRFLISLLFATWIPITVLVFIGLTDTVQYGLTQIKVVLLFLGGAHVQATLFFYWDREFRGIIRENRSRYIYIPLILILGSGLLFVIANQVIQTYLFLGYWAWQTYHYGRQNVGIYSFASIAQNIRVSKSERLALELATYCGILGTLKVLGSGVVPGYLTPAVELLYLAGFYGLIAISIFGTVAFLRNPGSSRIARGLFFFTLLIFFLPLYLSDNLLISFSSYAIAHGFQYLVFMTFVSLNVREKDTGVARRSLIVLGVVTLITGFICYRLADLRGYDLISQHRYLVTLLDFLVGAVFGGTLAHFVIDAGAWRLRSALPRAYITKRFGFIFD
jgi:hypothetical protein